MEKRPYSLSFLGLGGGGVSIAFFTASPHGLLTCRRSAFGPGFFFDSSLATSASFGIHQ